MKPKSKVLIIFAKGLIVFCYRIKQYSFASVKLGQLKYTYTV